MQKDVMMKVPLPNSSIRRLEPPQLAARPPRPSAPCKPGSGKPGSGKPGSGEAGSGEPGSGEAGSSHAARDQGFTLIEVLIVILIMGTLALVGIPNLLLMLERAKVSSALRESTNVLQIARQEAVRRGVDVVVLADTANDRLFAFANVDDDSGLLFQPNATAVARTADYRVSESPLPQGNNASTSIKFWGPADTAPNGSDIADGLNTDSSSRPVAVFEPDGSVRETGAFRIADARGNFFEIRIEPKATARIEVRKYYPSPPFASGASAFYPRGKDATSGANLWKWF